MGTAGTVTVANAPAPKAVASSDAPADPDREGDASEGAGAILLGPALFDVSSLNKRLQANGYEKLGSLMTFIGGEGHAVFPSGFVAGARGGAILGPSGAAPSDMRTRFSGGFGMVDFGYAFVHSEHLLLTLTGGIGGYGVELGIGDGQSVRFDDVLRDPRRSVSLGQGGVLVGLTLGIDGRVPIGRVERGRRGFVTIGLRLGGLYGPPLGDFSVSGGDNATDGPSTGLTGGYAAVAIGFGGGGIRAAKAHR